MQSSKPVRSSHQTARVQAAIVSQAAPCDAMQMMGKRGGRESAPSASYSVNNAIAMPRSLSCPAVVPVPASPENPNPLKSSSSSSSAWSSIAAKAAASGAASTPRTISTLRRRTRSTRPTGFSVTSVTCHRYIDLITARAVSSNAKKEQRTLEPQRLLCYARSCNASCSAVTSWFLRE